MAASSSSSSAAAGPTYAVWLYDPYGNRVVLVDLPVPLPQIVVYNGVYYSWSFNVYWRYIAAAPYAATPDLGSPPLSVLANPQQ